MALISNTAFCNVNICTWVINWSAALRAGGAIQHELRQRSPVEAFVTEC